MTAIASILASISTKIQPSLAKQVNQMPNAQSQTRASSFGEAVTINLSAAAKTMLANPNVSSNTSTESFAAGADTL